MAAVLAVAALAASPAGAEEPLTLTVRPSGVDTLTPEARAREARLQRRMQEADYLFRHICTRCGGGSERRGSTAPFNPIDALSAPRR
jgi:hypothetical protein